MYFNRTRDALFGPPFVMIVVKVKLRLSVPDIERIKVMIMIPLISGKVMQKNCLIAEAPSMVAAS